ncbi:MAG: HepT-like ribonuclease domain-containing protein [Chitinophagales bacterium]
MNTKKLKYILDIESLINEIEEIKKRVDNNFIVFKNDFMIKHAVERELSIIGEAIRKITEIDPQVPLTHIDKIIGLRNILNHAYDSIDDELIWA